MNAKTTKGSHRCTRCQKKKPEAVRITGVSVKVCRSCARKIIASWPHLKIKKIKGNRFIKRTKKVSHETIQTPV